MTVDLTHATLPQRLRHWAAASPQAVALRTAGRPYSLESAMAKLHATEMVAFVVDTAQQLRPGLLVVGEVERAEL